MERYRKNKKQQMTISCYSLHAVTDETLWSGTARDAICCYDKGCMACLCVSICILICVCVCVSACVDFRACGLGGTADVKQGN